MTRTSATHLAPQLGGSLLTQRHRGACTEHTAWLFFDDGRPAGRGIKGRHEAAKAICRLCPILNTCRAYARADPTLEGIWGGETQDERRIAPRNGAGTGLPAGNEEGQRLASLAVQLAQRGGLDAAAKALKVPPATLRRVFALYGLDQPPSPANPGTAPKGGEHPWPPPARRPPATATSSPRRGKRSQSSSPSRVGLSPGPAAQARQTTPATRPPDQPESPSRPA